MRLPFLVPCLAATLVFASCSKKDKSSEASTKKSSAADASGRSVLPPLEIAKADALWALAPDKTAFGAVAVPGSGKRLHETFMAMARVAEARPLGKTVLAELREKAREEKVDAFDVESFKKIGIDLDLGAAVFIVAEEEGYAIVPVSDRAAFRASTEGTVETIDGLEVDKHDDDFFCTQKHLYVCASSVAQLKEFGHKVDGALAKRVSGLPEMYRGDVELVADLAAIDKIEDMKFDPEFYDYFSDPGLGVMAVRFGNGIFTVRDWLEATPKGVLEGAATVPNTLSAAAATSKPNALVQFRVPPAAWTASLAAEEDQIIPGGLSLHNDILGNLTGEVLMYAPASKELSGTMSIGLKDPAPFKTLLNMACGMGGAIEGVKVTPGDGVCDILVDVAKLPLPDPSIATMFKEPLPVNIEVKSDQLTTRIGKAGAILESASVGGFGKDFLENKWSFSMWAEGISVANSNAIPWESLNGLPKETVDGIKLAVWMASHVYELGMAGAIRSDGVHLVMHVATYAGDPPEAYAAYQAAVMQSLDLGDATAAFAAISTQWPASMAGHQGTSGGSMLVAGVTGMLAAIAVPAFVKYQQASKEAAEAMPPDIEIEVPEDREVNIKVIRKKNKK